MWLGARLGKRAGTLRQFRPESQAAGVSPEGGSEEVCYQGQKVVFSSGTAMASIEEHVSLKGWGSGEEGSGGRGGGAGNSLLSGGQCWKAVSISRG